MKNKGIMAILMAAVILTVNVFFINTPTYGATSPTVYVDGRVLNTEVPPQIINDRVMVPYRAIGEAMGASVAWDPTDRKVSMSLNNTYVVMTINNPKMVVGTMSFSSDGGIIYTETNTVTLDSPPVIRNDRTLVPIRAIENMGASISWDATTRTVTANSPIAPTPAPRPTPSPTPTPTATPAPTGYTVSGRIMAQDTNSGLYASLQLKNSSGTSVGSTTYTDNSGYYTITNVPNGTYTIYVSASGYADATMSSFTVSNSNVSSRDYTLSRNTGYTVSGRVMSGSSSSNPGSPLAASVSVYNSSNQQIGNTVTADSSGYFTINNVPSGSGYTLRASYSGYNNYTSNTFTLSSSSSSNDIYMTSSYGTTGGPSGSGVITGRVTLNGSAVSSGTSVYIRGTNTGYSETAYTDSSGNYTTSSLQYDSYTITVTYQGYTRSIPNSSFYNYLSSNNNIEVTSSSGYGSGQIYGQVQGYSNSGYYYSNLRVNVYSSGGLQQYSTQVDSNGYYSIPYNTLSSGSYTVRCVDYNGSAISTDYPVTVDSYYGTSQAVNIYLGQGGYYNTISGRVVQLGTSSGISGVYLTFRDSNGVNCGTTTSGNDGLFTLPLPTYTTNGYYIIEASGNYRGTKDVYPGYYSNVEIQVTY